MRVKTAASLLLVACGIKLPDPPNPLSASQVIKQAKETAQRHPNSSQTQLETCRSLESLADTQREGPGPYAGRRVSTALLTEGIGEVFAESLLNAVAIDARAGAREPSEASVLCFRYMLALTVQNDKDKGLALVNHAPRIWEAVLAFIKTFKHTQEARDQFCTFAGLFGTPQPAKAAAVEVTSGAIDFVMGYFKNTSLKSDPEMFQKVWCALSDPVHEESGYVAHRMANFEGALRGIPLLTRALRECRESGSVFHESHGFGLLYQAMHVISGVLEHDDAKKSFANKFVSAGLVQEVVPMMKEEPDDSLLQDFSCEAMKWITDGNVTVQHNLANAGAIELASKALTKFAHGHPNGYSKVVGTCSALLLNFALTRTDWQDKMLRLNVFDSLDNEVFRQYPKSGSDDVLYRQKTFPNSNLYKLKEVLGLRVLSK